MIRDLGRAQSFFELCLTHVRDGRFARALALIAGVSALMSGLEVAQQHYRGSYGQKIMYSPVIFCLLLCGIGIWAAFLPEAARDFLFGASALLILDGVVGFGFHIRGLARKPGGWLRNLIFNIVMGPPLFAPLLLGFAGLLGVLSCLLLPEEAARGLPAARLEQLRLTLAFATALSALLNGCEALYSHYKARFAARSQWTPVVLAPPLLLAALTFALMPEPARVPLAIVAWVAVLAGSVGAAFHINGIFKRPGGRKHFFYNLIYGPPPFAPLLFAASGFLGLLATQIGNL